MRRIIPTLAALALVTTSLVAGQSAPDRAEARVDAVFARWNQQQSPGCAIGVAKDGSPVLQKAYGMADLEHDIPNRPDTVMRLRPTAKDEFCAGSRSFKFIRGTNGAVNEFSLRGSRVFDLRFTRVAAAIGTR